MKMNVRMKRLISFLMALVMALTLVPVPVNAAEAVTMTGGEVLYLKPNSNWLNDNPRFAAYFFGNGVTWADMEPVPGNEGYYQVTVPAGSWTNVIFCRMSPTSTTNDWTCKWNQTGDLAYDGVNNLFTVPEDYWDGATTGWSQWEPAAEESAAEITGLSITIDGVVYDNTNTAAANPAVITPDSTVVVTAHGTNLFEDTVSADHYCVFSSGHSGFLNSGWWTFSADGSSASMQGVIEEFLDTTTAFEMTYSNTGTGADGRVYSGVYIIYRETVEVPEEPEPDVETRTIYFDNSEGWTNVNAYYWSAENTSMTTWPGEAMTLVEGSIWSIEIPENAVYIIFNNGSTQTDDLTIHTECKNLYTYSTDTWSVYSGSGADVHSYDETTLLCSCGAVSPDAVAVLSKDDINVMAYSDLQTAVNDAKVCTAEDKAVLKLLKSVDLGDDNLSIWGGTFTLDLSGFTVTSALITQGVLYIDGFSDLNICNGTIDGNNSAIQLEGGTLTLSELILTDASAGICVLDGEIILRQCDIQTQSGVRVFGGSVAVYDSSISTNYDIEWRDGTVALHEGTEFPGGIAVIAVNLDAILAEGMAYWQGNTMIGIGADDTEISDGDVTVKAVCTHENGTASCRCKDGDSHYVTYSCCGVTNQTDPHSFDENGVCTACGFAPSNSVTIHMTDDYGDGWNGNAIQVYEDGILVATVTIDDGSTGTWMGTYDASKLYMFYWVQGSFSSECGFEIMLGAEVLFTAAKGDCAEYADGQLLCSNCQHSYGEGVVTAPSCTVQGYTTYTCTLCGLSYEDDYVDSLGDHSKAEGDEGTVTDPTCTEQGYTTYTCTVCGESFEEDYVDSLGHVHAEDDEGTVTAPTCIEQGYTTYTCTVCGESFIENYVAALGHSKAEGDEGTVTAPSCTDEGYTTYICAACGGSFTDDEVGILGHVLGEDGNCTVCGELYSVPVRVADVQITFENMADILEDGTASYNPETNTLTLDGFIYDDTADGIFSDIPLNIVLLGENEIVTENEGIDFALGHTDGTAKISGTGSLTINSADEGIEVEGSGNANLTIGGSVTIEIDSGNDEGIRLLGENSDLIIQDKAKVIIGTEDDPIGEECIYVYPVWNGSVTIMDNAYVSVANTDEEGIYVGGDNSQTITITGGTVYADADEEGLDANDIHISGGRVETYGGRGYEGIYADNLTISGGYVTTGGYGQAIEVDNLTITGGILEVTEGGIVCFTADHLPGTITLTDAEIVEPKGATIGSFTHDEEGDVLTILDVDGNYADAFVIDGHEDTDNDGRCDYCDMLMQPALLRMVSISLKGNIALNYYMLLSDEVLSDSTAYMQFTMADGEIIRIPVSEGVATDYNGEIYYKFTCAVNAKEMTDDVVSQFFYEGGSTAEHTYNVKTYADHILANSTNEEMKDLVIAMLNYGAASQIHFGYNTDAPANAGLAAPDYSGVAIEGFDAVSGQGTELAKFYSASLILKSETTLRFFFTGAITASCNGQELEVKQRSGLYYVDVVGIAAKDLDEDVTITISDGTNTAEVSFNPMSYCQSVLNDTTGTFDQEMKDLVCALHLYNQAANTYFEEN